MNLRLPLSARLRRQKIWQQVLHKGKRRQIDELLVITASGAEEGACLGIRLSRKTGSAVIRNRLRRLLREEFRLMRPDLPSDLVFIVSTQIRLDEPQAQKMRQIWHEYLAQLVVKTDCANC